MVSKESTLSSSYSLGSHFESFVKDQLSSGRYSNASEVIRSGLRLLEDYEEGREARAMSREQKIEWLKAEIQKGADSGPSIPWDDAMNELESRKATRAAKRDRLEAA